MKPPYLLLLICLGALALRLVALAFVPHPGIGDPNHYYNLGVRLLEGRGFSADYIWMYTPPPDALDHPETHWMPLTAVLAAGGMALFGVNVPAATAPFILIGALLPIIGYAAARQFGVGAVGSLFAAAALAALPEFVLNSVRTDTTIPSTALVCMSILCLTHGLQCGRVSAFVASGVAAGLAYLTRNDGALLLPMLVVTGGVYVVRGRKALTLNPAPSGSGTSYSFSLREKEIGDEGIRWRCILLMPLAALIVVTPWMIRTAQLTGSPTAPETRQMFFFTRQIDHYAYGREYTLQTMLAEQTPAQLIGKRLFELAAAVKLMYTTLDMALPVAVVGGLILLTAARDRKRWLTLAPTLILLLGVVVAYPLLIPLKSQSGSFKKAYLTLIPMLLPLAGYALERAITDKRLQIGVAALVVIFMSANAVELVRSDARLLNAFMDANRKIVETVHALPDTNGDGDVVLMGQDPFMLRFFGVRSVIIPYADRDTTLAVARRYGVDYLLMPPDRPALDPLYTGAESDPRFVLAARVPGTEYTLYAVTSDE